MVVLDVFHVLYTMTGLFQTINEGPTVKMLKKVTEESNKLDSLNKQFNFTIHLIFVPLQAISTCFY